MFEKAAEMSPSDEGVMGNLADGYRWAGRQDKAAPTYKKAIALCNKDLQINPRNSGILGHMALYYAKSGDLGKAPELLQRANSISPGESELYLAGPTLETIATRQADAVAVLKFALGKG